MPSTFTPVFPSSESQKRWTNHMRLNYINNYTVRPCVFHVPDNLRDAKPEAYTPQLVGLGPYHHFWPQVQHMESHKRAAVLAYLEDLDKKRFIKLVEQSPEDFEPKIRSSYDRYLDLDKEALAWVVIVDGLFLLELIDYLGSVEPKKNNPGSEDVEKDKLYSKPEALAADVLMLENQIPIVLIQEMRVILQKCFNIHSDSKLFGKFLSFCNNHSPLKLTSNSTSKNEAFDKTKHLLDFMYQMIVKNKIRDFNIVKKKIEDSNAQNNIEDSNAQNNPQDDGNNNHDSETNQELNGESRVGAIAKEVASHAGEYLEHAIEEFDFALSDAKIAGIKLPGNVEKVTNILRNLQKNILHVNHKKDGSLGDQMDIPSAWRLHVFLKITFKPLPEGCGIGNITLDTEKRILYLPVITLRANSEVILRNLVAYEVGSKMGSTEMRDYVDLLCGLIKSKKDVDLLETYKVIECKIPAEEIARMCNGIKKSDEKPDEESKVPDDPRSAKSDGKPDEESKGPDGLRFVKEVTGAVKELNNKFNNVGIVKASRCCMKVSADCVKFWRPLFPMFVVLLLLFQSVCEIWDCRRRSSFGGGALRDLYLGDLDPQATLMLPRKMYPY